MDDNSRGYALAQHLGTIHPDVEVIDEHLFETDGEEWLVLDDTEADDRARDEIEQGVWAFNASFLAGHTGLPEVIFEKLAELSEEANEPVLAIIERMGDLDRFVQDAIEADGRGHFIARWDGQEVELPLDDLYAYRMQ